MGQKTTPHPRLDAWKSARHGQVLPRPRHDGETKRQLARLQARWVTIGKGVGQSAPPSQSESAQSLTELTGE